MYGKTNRSSEYVNSLLDFIKHEYGIDATSITPAKRGFFGETWKIGTNTQFYFVKLDYSHAHKYVYEQSLLAVEHLRSYGIKNISSVVRTKNSSLSTCYGDAVIGIFEWINGENIETDETKIPEYHMMAKVYTVPAIGLAIPAEDFSGGSADKFFSQWKDINDKNLNMLFEKNRGKLEFRANRLKSLANDCQKDKSGFFITHGDAGGNMIKNENGYFIVDWDEAKLAPPERDAWNMLNYEGKSGWARCLFQKALKSESIDYALQNKRLLYYCYYYYFFYLTEHLDAYMQLGDIHEEVMNYFSGWVESRASFADRQ